MYIPGDQPEQLDLLLNHYHECCRQLQTPKGSPVPLLPGRNCHDLPAGQVLQVCDGVLDVMYNERIALILQPGDLFQIPDIADWPLKLRSEDSGQLRLINQDTLHQALRDPLFAEQYTRLLTYQNQALLLAFAAANRHGMRPTAGFRRLAAGTPIIRTGTSSTEVFTLMRGEARVEVQGVTVGSVHEGEIFGVLSALADTPYSTNIIAETDVTLMCVPSDEFIQLIQAQPETFMRLLRTLSRHIDELNSRLLQALGTDQPASPPSTSDSDYRRI